MNHERIQLTDTPINVVAKLSEGNPGAVRVCTDLMRQGAQIDPDAIGGGLSSLLSLDTHALNRDADATGREDSKVLVSRMQRLARGECFRWTDWRSA